MKLIDTHGHINFAAFRENWVEVVRRAQDGGLVAIVMPGSQLATSARAVELARAQPNFLFAAVGLHPTHVWPSQQPAEQETGNSEQETTGKYEDFDYGRYLALARQPQVVGIGEVGLDSYRIEKSEIRSTKSETFLDEQERILHEFVRLAQEVKKPMILHCRGVRKPGDRIQKTEDRRQIDPHERLIALLAAVPAVKRPRFVVHCYQGTVDQAQRYLALGGFISFTGTITYSNDPAVTEVIQTVPLDRLMIETDSPYLSPVPYRGEPNEPWKVVEVARRVAELQGKELTTVAAQTTANAKSFFSLPLVVT